MPGVGQTGGATKRATGGLRCRILDGETIGHVPVLVEQVLDVLAPQPGETLVDLTIGRGGHSEAIGRRVGTGGRVVGFDLDIANVDFARARVAASGCRVQTHHANFVDAPAMLRRDGVRADMVLADLGFASTQMDDPRRGFSFRAEGPLDMRLDPTAAVTAEQIINESGERGLADLIFRYGEEPLARKIAREIVAERTRLPISTTQHLAEVVRRAYGNRARHSRMHPATKTFMALRIAVNDELARLEGLWDELERTADEARRGGGWLNAGARLAFISFHSLEDRIIKQRMAALTRRGAAQRITRKPLIAGEEETALNPRARSAKLRAIRITPPD